MDLDYLKDKICDEVKDAKDYATKAIELKPMAPSWAKIFIDMANAELTHASSLYKMFVEYYQKIAGSFSETPSYIEDMYKDVIKCYTHGSAEARMIIDMYSK